MSHILKHRQGNGVMETTHSSALTIKELRDTLPDILPSNSFTLDIEGFPLSRVLCCKFEQKYKTMIAYFHETINYDVHKYLRSISNDGIIQCKFTTFDMQGNIAAELHFNAPAPKPENIVQVFDTTSNGPQFQVKIKNCNITYVKNQFGLV